MKKRKKKKKRMMSLQIGQGLEKKGEGRHMSW